ncbi:tRNA (5-methylaminomethyl-2-thiouridine)(34)-methyltransferase MnmD [Marinifilum sp. D714]|uniref:tRNA (5-methylaminomethyl-2-thiouridine)(34)-methyltransferase MnmD n=1 Tax=Marinifilum sp. D714 TaxID=2937523 RepID=UPI0027C8A812|nr:tRNA (5-methylaminomethyl-2-thiouridine)(34)-methyltransferase MnmD [Marinifilum sp. D714]MDQ2178125.1 tRNA (5-methylaminomethyl-2-thiouridine)(34)-methyltransferase MnmD [Marinifilum sp. D714]
MNKLKRELKVTEDGSHTFYMPDLDEHYHSTHGAMQESMHIFLNAGFHFSQQDPLHILEIGFGTGLNCFLTVKEAEKLNRKVIYHSIELYPLEKELVKDLNYANPSDEASSEMFQRLHSCEWNTDIQINENFTLHKLQGDLIEYNFPSKYDLVYFDAFAPDVQPDLWTQDIFEKIYKATNSEAILTTYCTKGIVKRALRAAGFQVKRLPGPPGKRQMLRATRIDDFESTKTTEQL